jgi:hypothetical protein
LERNTHEGRIKKHDYLSANHGININTTRTDEAEFPDWEGIGNGFQLDNTKHTRIVVTATATKRRQ